MRWRYRCVLPRPLTAREVAAAPATSTSWARRWTEPPAWPRAIPRRGRGALDENPIVGVAGV